MKKTNVNHLLMLLLCGFLVFLSACSPAGNTGKNDNNGNSNGINNNDNNNDARVYDVNDYLPLAAGNKWIYLGEGNEYASYNEKVLYREGDLAQLSRDNGGTIMALINKIEADKIVLVHSQEEFYEDTNILDTPADREDVILQGPFTVGAAWEAAERLYTIEALDEEVTVTAGVFEHCLKVVSTFPDSSHTITQYYAPGFGMVKSEFSDGENQVTSSLESYTVN